MNDTPGFVARRSEAGAARAAAWLLALALVGGCGADRATEVEFGGPTMGSTWSVKINAGPEGLDATERALVEERIRSLLDRLNALMSTWDDRSELSRFNRSTSLEPFPVAPDTFEVFRWAVDLAGQTDGAFDVTMGPLVEAWGFGPAPQVDVTRPPPDDATIARLKAASGLHLLQLDPAGRWVRKQHPALRCDFSALVPGYAADRIAVLLEERGHRNVLIDIGGELVARGLSGSGTPWQVAIEQPREDGRAIARIVPLTAAAIATSGDYRNYREVAGERLSHIIDPVTGRPIRHRLASATVIDRLAVRADALATALMVLGENRGMALAERLGVAAVLMVRRPDGTFESRVSSHFDRLVGDR